MKINARIFDFFSCCPPVLLNTPFCNSIYALIRSSWVWALAFVEVVLIIPHEYARDTTTLLQCIYQYRSFAHNPSN
jgi:hypothetical protein